VGLRIFHSHLREIELLFARVHFRLRNVPLIQQFSNWSRRESSVSAALVNDPVLFSAESQRTRERMAARMPLFLLSSVAAQGRKASSVGRRGSNGSGHLLSRMSPLFFPFGLHVQGHSSALQASAVVTSASNTAESDRAKIGGMATAQII
jgi:hypothetical protein